MAEFSEQQQSAHQAIGEVTADLGASFVLNALADALYNEASTEVGVRGDNLSQAVGILRQLAEVLEEEC